MQMHPVLRIGLTGGIGSGKSTVCKMFEDLGIPVIDADEIAHNLTRSDETVRQLLLQSFGPEIFADSGGLDRSSLRNLIFSDDVSRNKLENILHPLIYKEIECRIKSLNHDYCIICIPLLFETHAQDKVDRVLVIDTPEEQQIIRTIIRDNTDRNNIIRIMRAQCTRTQRLSIADDVIHNNGDLANLQKQVYILHQYYNKIAGAKTET